MKKIVLIFFLILSAVLPLVAKAEAIVLDCYKQGNCNFCDALKFGVKLAGILLTIAGSLSLLFFIIAGLILIISQGNASRLAMAQKIIIGSIIGLVLTYTAWVGVNFIIANFVGQGQTGVNVAQIFGKKWQEFKCQKEEESVFTPSKPSEPVVTPSGACGYDIGISCGGNCGGIQTSGISSTQCSDASIKKPGSTVNKLTELLTCINNKKNSYTVLVDGEIINLADKDLIITSISDDNGLNNCRESYVRQCDQENNIITNCCWHTKNSCHYGGPLKNMDGSYAADFRSRSTTNPRQNYNSKEEAAFKSLVGSCGGQYNWEKDHFHVSVYACGGL